MNVNLRERPSCGGLLELALTCDWTPSVMVALNALSTKQRHVDCPTSPIGHLHHPVLCLFDSHVVGLRLRMQVLKQRRPQRTRNQQLPPAHLAVSSLKFMYKMPSCSCNASH